MKAPYGTLWVGMTTTDHKLLVPTIFLTVSYVCHLFTPLFLTRIDRNAHSATRRHATAPVAGPEANTQQLTSA